MIVISNPGNNTLSNIDCSKASTLQATMSACIITGILPACNPPDTLGYTMLLDNHMHDGKSVKRANEFVYVPAFISEAIPYRQIDIVLKNQFISNLDYASIMGLYYFWLTGSERLHLSNFVFTNITKIPHLVEAINFKSLLVDDFHLEENINLRTKILSIISPGDVHINGMYLKNYTNAGGSQSPAIEITPGPLTNIIIQRIFMNSVELYNVPF